MRLTRLLGTAAFRLSMLYAGVFALSVLLLGAVVFWTTRAALERQLTARIEFEIATLAAVYRGGGITNLENALRQRERSEAWGRFRYRLFAGGRAAADGSLMLDTPPPPGWADLEASTGGVSQPLRIRTIALDDTLALSVAGGLSAIRDVESAILEAFGWGLAATLLLGVGGGLFVSARFLARVDGITTAAEAIINGNLKQRIPVRKTNDDLDRLALTLNRMLDRISELMESIRQVSSDIAHDLRTPLSRLRHRLESALASSRSQEDLRDTIATAIGDTEDILATFSALLRIAQIEAGTRRAAFADLDLSLLVTDVVEAFAPSIQDACKKLKTAIAPGLHVIGDPELLTQLLANLIENAIRHTPPDTNIEVLLRRTGTGSCLTVADNGAGVPPDARDKLFQRFYRLEQSRTTPGSGLGLSLVKAIADLHDARIELTDNDPGLGVAVFLRGERPHERDRRRREPLTL